MRLPHALLTLALAACVATGPPPPPTVHGLLYEGSRLSGSSTDGPDWSIKLAGDDLMILVDGARATLLGAAENGSVAYRTVGDEWTLRLPEGEARWTMTSLVVHGVAYELQQGEALVFTSDGHLQLR